MILKPFLNQKYILFDNRILWWVFLPDQMVYLLILNFLNYDTIKNIILIYF